jgi:hypothetical protein
MNCIRCNIDLNDENYTYKTTKSWRKKICDDCWREDRKQYYTKNREKLLERNRQYYVKNQEKSKQYNIKNREKILDYHKKYNAENREKTKNGKLKSTYGIGLDEFKKILEEQNYKCKICGAELELVFGRKNKKTPHVDHNHKTGRIRGVLCNSCNVMLGCACDNLEVFEKAIEYLRNDYIIERNDGI